MKRRSILDTVNEEEVEKERGARQANGRERGLVVCPAYWKERTKDVERMRNLEDARYMCRFVDASTLPRGAG